MLPCNVKHCLNLQAKATWVKGMILGSNLPSKTFAKGFLNHTKRDGNFIISRI